MKLNLSHIFGGGRDTNSPVVEGRPISFGNLFGGNNILDVSNTRISATTLLDVYRKSSDVRNCVREIRKNIGKSGWRIVDADDSEKEVNPKIIEEVRLLLNSPSSTHNTLKELTDRVTRDLEIVGNTYIAILRNMKGEMVGLQPIDPRTMAVVADNGGQILRYIQRVAGKDVHVYDPKDIVYIKNEDDTLNETIGMGNLEPIMWDARTDLAATVSNYKFFENNAIPSALYILDERLTAEQIKDKVEVIKKEFGGAKNRGKVGAMLGVKDVKTLSVSQKDMEFLNGRRFTTQKICAAFGVPEFLLGYTEKVNNNNGVELEENFMTKTVVPLEQKIAQAITEQVLAQLGYNILFEFKPHLFENAADTENRAINLYKSGLKTARQAKQMIGDEITDTDEENENLDKLIIHQGAGAVLLDDVGVDPVLDPSE